MDAIAGSQDMRAKMHVDTSGAGGFVDDQRFSNHVRFASWVSPLSSELLGILCCQSLSVCKFILLKKIQMLCFQPGLMF